MLICAYSASLHNSHPNPSFPNAYKISNLPTAVDDVAQVRNNHDHFWSGAGEMFVIPSSRDTGLNITWGDHLHTLTDTAQPSEQGPIQGEGSQIVKFPKRGR